MPDLQRKSTGSAEVASRRLHLAMYFPQRSLYARVQSDIDLSTTICNVKSSGSSPSGKKPKVRDMKKGSTFVGVVMLQEWNNILISGYCAKDAPNECYFCATSLRVR